MANNLKTEILHYALQQYGCEPEYLWKNYPTYAVLRHQDNNKWYAILMSVCAEHLGLLGTEKIDVMNVKCSPEMQSMFVTQTGFLPAYHMNKSHWISILLDGSVDKESIIFLLNSSFDLTASKRHKKKLGIVRYNEWILPANPKYYDVEKYLHEGMETLWKQSNNIAVGDQVYIYVTEPTGAIRYKCEVLEVNIPYESEREDLMIKRVMKVKCLKEYDNALITRDKMKAFGVSAVRGPRHMPYCLKTEIELLEQV
ncbi:MmcQ/YjbR family DNA-binding protein [Pasteurella bettyae]|uniref:PF04237 family protein n=1 Tax=Pasteurella bettyae CCUG 2042 TaxID=1095749 RepID=I3D6D9_9PAST|nr:MmcQ/YjbR family DNA-binding protein [Pasteurella bettyae]EIJ67282.1 PF04237 family protein [Pasteurella bettyae CCUG 2042]SUB21134.1 protein YyaQ [Pasteurella bettyae]